jgi:hypothetical protein
VVANSGICRGVGAGVSDVVVTPATLFCVNNAGTLAPQSIDHWTMLPVAVDDRCTLKWLTKRTWQVIETERACLELVQPPLAEAVDGRVIATALNAAAMMVVLNLHLA